MKKSLIVAMWLAIAGIVLCIVGAVGGGTMSQNEWGLGIFSYKQDTYNSIIDNQNITNLELNLGMGDIKIVKGDEFKVEGALKKGRELKAEVKNGVLIIEETRRVLPKIFGTNNDNVTIYIPENFVFEKVNIEVGACKIQIEDINVSGVFNLEIGAGEAIISNLTAGEVKLECGAGEITGSVKANNVLDIDCGMGNVEINLDKNNQEYNYDLSVGMGSLKVGDIKIDGAGEQKVKNTEENKNIKVECGMGNVTVKF